MFSPFSPVSIFHVQVLERGNFLNVISSFWGCYISCILLELYEFQGDLMDLLTNLPRLQQQNPRESFLLLLYLLHLIHLVLQHLHLAMSIS